MVAAAASLALAVSALASTATDLPVQSSAYNAAWQSAPGGYVAPANDGLGVRPGSIGHVWVIVLENHAYEQSFTPLEGTQSSYLQQLPNQGALLTHYYGTGHSSLDNYVSMVSGQAPQADDQLDCSNYSAMDATVDTSGTPATNADFGQAMSNAGPDAPGGDNGCVYPSSVKTIFNQLDSAGKSWKVYAQDLGGGIGLSGGTTLAAPHANQDAGAGTTYNAASCGAPDPSIVGAPDQNGSYSSPAAGAGTGANTNFASTNGLTGTVDSYVAKHNPLPWFSALTGTADTTGGTINSTECSKHLAAMFGPNDQLYNDLQDTSSDPTPDLSYIVPDNCSDGHDAICTGNNLSGGTSDGYSNGSINAATNDTGGTAAESNFLSIVIPEIEKSPAFKHNGMIVVTYDEAYPPFTYTGDSQASSQLQTADATGSLQNDAAGETLFSRSLNWEPTGPNTTIVKSARNGQALTGGPGDDAYIDLPTTAGGGLVACPVVSGSGTTWATFTAPTPTNGKCLPGAQANGEHPTTSQTIHVDLTNGSAHGTTLETEAGVSELDQGAQVTTAGIASSFSFPADGNDGNVYIGQVTNAPNAGDSTTAASVFTSNVSFVDNLGAPLTYTGPTTSQLALALSLQTSDPFFDAYDATMGGGDPGAVVISPFVKPGTVSNTYYNHYALLRTIEDVFGEQSNGTNDLTDGIIPAGTTGGSTGDTDGPYLGFAAQPGLSPFGSDVFKTRDVHVVTHTITKTVTVKVPVPTHGHKDNDGRRGHRKQQGNGHGRGSR